MLKNKDFKIKKLGDYNKVIITRGMEFSELGKYSLENKKNFEKIKNKLELSVGKKLKEIVAFGEQTEAGIVDIEKKELLDKDHYGDMVVRKATGFSSAYSESNTPICTRIQQKSNIIVSLVNNRGDKVICKLDINKIEKLRRIIVTKLENKEKKSEIKAVLYCNRDAIISIKEIINFKEKLKKLRLREEGLVKYEFDRGYVINVPKLICDLFEYKVSSDIQIIKNEEEDINNLLLFL